MARTLSEWFRANLVMSSCQISEIGFVEINIIGNTFLKKVFLHFLDKKLLSCTFAVFVKKKKSDF